MLIRDGIFVIRRIRAFQMSFALGAVLVGATTVLASPVHAGDVVYPILVRRSQPVYPREAREAGIEGKVILEALVRRDGTIGSVKILSAHPRGMGFEEAARDAVSRWRYRPGLQYGEAVDVYLPIVIEFPPVGHSPADGHDNWNELVDEAAELLQRGEVAAAEPRLLKAMAEAESFSVDDLRLARTRELLAAVRFRQGALADAARLCREALTQRESVEGADHPDLAEALTLLSEVLRAEGKQEEAAALAQRAASLSNRIGAGH
jgi:TonB family protein